jgi:hypothetical protein
VWRVSDTQIPVAFYTGLYRSDLRVQPEKLGAAFIRKAGGADTGSRSDLAIFIQTVRKWHTVIHPHLRAFVDGEPSLVDEHIDIARLYLFLGVKGLHAALPLGRSQRYESQRPLRRAMNAKNIHLLWRELFLFADEG